MPPRSRQQAKSRAQKVAEPISTSEAGSAEQAENAAQQTSNVEQETVGQGHVIPISLFPSFPHLFHLAAHQFHRTPLLTNQQHHGKQRQRQSLLLCCFLLVAKILIFFLQYRMTSVKRLEQDTAAEEAGRPAKPSR